MRCQCCNDILTDYEATRKFKESGEYADMCNKCVKEMPDDIEFIGRHDLLGDVGDTTTDETEGDSYGLPTD